MDGIVFLENAAEGSWVPSWPGQGACTPPSRLPALALHLLFVVSLLPFALDRATVGGAIFDLAVALAPVAELMHALAAPAALAAFFLPGIGRSRRRHEQRGGDRQGNSFHRGDLAGSDNADAPP